MSGTSRGFYKASAIALGLALSSFIFSAVAHAASINYGNFGPVPPGVLFTQVTESSGTDPVPLYGPPAPFSVGLDFDPTNFVATSANGGVDLTDGQLNFTINSPANIGITGVSLFEAGDYTILGFPGTPATTVIAGAILRATVTQINGVNVAPIPLLPSNASFSDSLPGNAIVQPWALGTGLAINLGAGQRATRVDVVINNQLIAASEVGTAAFIAKKDFSIDVDTDVPEPTTVALAGVAICGLGFASRKR